jgi:hypothetical protein
MAVLGSDNLSHSTTFKFNINSADRVTIDSSGRLLVGTSTKLGSTEKKLEVVNGTIGLANFSANAFGSSLLFEKGRGTSVGTIVQANDGLGNIIFRADDGLDSFTTAAQISAAVDGTPGANDMPGRLVFSTTADGANTPAERMRITNNGRVLVGTTAPIAPSSGTSDGISLDPNGTIVVSCPFSSLGLRRRLSNGFVAAFYRDTTFVGSISVTTTNTAYNTSSDYRLKENILPASIASKIIDEIQVRSFDWKIDGSHQRYGVIAQEVEEIYPEAISKGNNEDDMWSVDYSKFVPILLKEIQDLRARVLKLEVQ